MSENKEREHCKVERDVSCRPTFNFRCVCLYIVLISATAGCITFLMSNQVLFIHVSLSIRARHSNKHPIHSYPFIVVGPIPLQSAGIFKSRANKLRPPKSRPDFNPIKKHDNVRFLFIQNSPVLLRFTRWFYPSLTFYMFFVFRFFSCVGCPPIADLFVSNWIKKSSRHWWSDRHKNKLRRLEIFLTFGNRPLFCIVQ